jgi:tetratricopeptide (TPR) repeat protein
MIRTSAVLALLGLALGLAPSLGCAPPPPPTTPILPDPGAVAETYAAAGRYDEAAREIDLAVRAHPRDATLRQQAARIHEHAGNTGKAVGHLEAALRLTPSDPQIWIELGDIETRRDNTADAYVAYRRAAELAPDEIRAVAGLALAADHLGFEEEAEAAYERWEALEKALEVDSSAEPGD